MWPTLIAAALAAGLYNTDNGRPWIEKIFGMDNSSYQDTLDANQQIYDDYIKLMQEEATKNMPFQQGLLWQLMTGGDPSQINKFIWGDQWSDFTLSNNATADNGLLPQPDPPTTISTVSSVKTMDPDEMSNLEEWAWLSQVIGPYLTDTATNWFGWDTNFADDVSPYPWETSVYLTNRILGTDIGKEDLPEWLGGDISNNPLEAPVDIFNKVFGTDVGKDDILEPWSRWRSPSPQPDETIYPEGSEWDRYWQIVGDLMSQKYKIENVEFIQPQTDTGENVGNSKIRFTVKDANGNTDYRSFNVADVFPLWPANGIKDVEFDPNNYALQIVRNPDAFTPYENMIYELMQDDIKRDITNMSLSDDKTKLIIETVRQDGNHDKETWEHDLTEIFPNIDLSGLDSLEFNPDTLGVEIKWQPTTSGNITDVNYNRDTGKVTFTFEGGVTRTGDVKDVFPNIDIGSIYDLGINKDGRIVAYTTKNLDNFQKEILEKGETPSSVEYDKISNLLTVTYPSGREVYDASALFPDIDISQFDNIYFDENGNLVGSSNDNQEPQDISTPEQIEGPNDSVIVSNTNPDLQSDMTAEGFLNTYAPDIRNEFMAGSSLGDLMLSGWKQDSQSMLGDAARLEKEGLQQVTNLAAFRNPYGFSGSAEGVARDLEQNTIIPTKLEALRYPQVMTDQAAMATLGELMDEPMLNYPMPATIQPDYYSSAATQQLVNLGLTALMGLDSGSTSALNYLDTRNASLPSFVSPTSPTMAYPKPSYISSYPAY